MNRYMMIFTSFLIAAVFLCAGAAFSQSMTIGLFDGHTDVGAVNHPGSVDYNAAQGSYTISGSGENMWADADAFQFLWKRMSGDVSLTADITWIGVGGNEHRKACLIIRQNLDPGSPYIDAAYHGVGLTSLQFRDEPDGDTHEIQVGTVGPNRIRLEKRGDTVFMSFALAGEELHPAGGSYKIAFTEPFYVGLGVCAHDSTVVERAVFSNVELTSPPAMAATGRQTVESTLEIVPIASTDRRVLHHAMEHFEAPNWSRDGDYLLFNQGGRIYRIAATGGDPQVVDTGFATRCNNDHGISFDGTTLAISDQSREGGQSLIYVLPVEGGTPRRVTALSPSYWHGWSPDGRTLTYCADRNGEFDVYTIPLDGGEETRLTTAPGLDDGPEYSPDGQYIYFNSERTGRMQIWRMRPDGSRQEQVTDDEYNNWFAHPSPDGRYIVFLSYLPDVTGHPANQDVMLRLMPVDGGAIRVIAKLFGGQGTINVPSWSPDSSSIAFVSYRLVGQ